MDLTNMSHEQLIAEFKKIQEEKAQLEEAAKAKAERRISLKVGEKGGLSVYGMGRFPITMYREQWLKLFGEKEAIETFLNSDAFLKDPRVIANEFARQQKKGTVVSNG